MITFSFLPTPASSTDQSTLIAQSIILNNTYRLFQPVDQNLLTSFACELSDYQNLLACNKEADQNGKKGVYRRVSIAFDQNSRRLFYAFVLHRQSSGSLEPSFRAQVLRISQQVGQPQRHITVQLPDDKHPSHLVYWGSVQLVPLSDTERFDFMEGKKIYRGYLVDYALSLPHSAKQNHPIYSMRGGAGLLINYRVDNDGTQQLASRIVAPEAFSPSTSQPSPPPMGRQTPPSPPPPVSVSSGTGFSVSNDGFIITNYHVVDGCNQITVRGWGPASIKSYDNINDLALLRVQEQTPSATFRTSPVGLGETVFALGFPYPGILGQGLNVTDGLVSSLSGIQNDTRYLQITAPVQPGNSGGPLVDSNGLVVGVVSMRLNEIEVLKRRGSLPQNVNFAIRGDLAKSFLRANAIDPSIAEPRRVLSASEVAKQAQAYTVQVVCYGASTPKVGEGLPGTLPAGSR